MNISFHIALTAARRAPDERRQSSKNGPDGSDHPGSSRGFALGLGAYALWGVLPIYFKLLGTLGAVDIVAHRILWSLPFLALLIAVSRGWPKVRAVAADSKTLGVLTGTALLIGVNWLLSSMPSPAATSSPPASAII